MSRYYHFKNTSIGPYDVLIHATERDMQELLAHFNRPDAIPDIMPAILSPDGTDYYLFVLSTEKKIITPLWNFNYAYGHVYDGEEYVGEEIVNFTINIDDCLFEYFTDFDKDIVENRKDRNTWPDKRPVFRLNTISKKGEQQ